MTDTTSPEIPDNLERDLEAQIEDGIHMENLAERHGVDALALLDKLHDLHPAETLALLDAVERWWNAEERPEYPQL